MKKALLELLAVLGLTLGAGTLYNFANSGDPEKYLTWVDTRYSKLALVVDPKPADKPPAPAAAAQAPATPAPPASPGSSSPPSTPPVEPSRAGGARPAGAAEFSQITLAQAFEEFQSGAATFIDARRTREYEAGHITGAIPMSAHEADLFDKINKLREEAVLEAPVVIYCSNAKECEDSKLVANQLKEAGFLNLLIYTGGFPEWEREKAAFITRGKEPGKKDA